MIWPRAHLCRLVMRSSIHPSKTLSNPMEDGFFIPVNSKKNNHQSSHWNWQLVFFVFCSHAHPTISRVSRVSPPDSPFFFILDLFSLDSLSTIIFVNFSDYLYLKFDYSLLPLITFTWLLLATRILLVYSRPKHSLWNCFQDLSWGENMLDIEVSMGEKAHFGILMVHIELWFGQKRCTYWIAL